MRCVVVTPLPSAAIVIGVSVVASSRDHASQIRARRSGITFILFDNHLHLSTDKCRPFNEETFFFGDNAILMYRHRF